MKVLLGTCVSNKVQAQLEAAGHDVVWVGEGPDPGDEKILGRAYREQRVLVTIDKDFGTLAVFHKQPHCGIIRLVNFGTHQQGLVCLQILADDAEGLAAGAIITAQRHRLRKRPGKK